MNHTRIVYLGMLLVCLEGGCVASHATLELAASSALRAGTTQLRTAHEEWAGDLDAADAGREADIIAAFAADVVRDAGNPDAVARNKRAFAAALTKIRSDRDAAAERRRTASDNLDTIDEIADGLAQLARSSMNLDDEAQRYFGLWMKARDDAEKQRAAEQAARKAKRQAAIDQAVQAATGAIAGQNSPPPLTSLNRMRMMSEAQRKLLETLDAIASGTLPQSVPGDNDGDGDVDAIDRVLGEPARVSRATRLRQSEEFQKFREALTDGLIANDAAIAVLGLVNKLIDLKVIRF